VTVRRVLGFVLVGLAALSLALAGFFRFYVLPNAQRTPLNLNITLYGQGNGNVFDLQSGKPVAGPVTSVRHVRVDSNASTGSVVVTNQGICVMRNVSIPTDCLPASDPRLIEVVTERIAADRYTGQSVNGPQYQSELNGEPVKHVGLTLKFPFNTQKQTYQFWDYNIGKARPAVFAGTTTISGLTVYQFTINTPKTKITIEPAGVPGTYTDNRTLYVEPETGTIIKAVDHQIKRLSDGTLAADLQISTAPRSIDEQASKARSGRDQIGLAGTWLPIGLAILGVLLAVAAAFVLRKARGNAPPPSHEWTPAEWSTTSTG
jgi:hypothetical protein